MEKTTHVDVEVDISEVMDGLDFQDILDYVTERFGPEKRQALESVRSVNAPNLLAEYLTGKLTLTNARMVEDAVSVLRVP